MGRGGGALEADGVPGMSALCGRAPCLLAHSCSINVWVKEDVRGWPLPLTRALDSQDGLGPGGA